MSLFKKLMLYLTLFFLVVWGVTWVVLSLGFEQYYTNSRLERLRTNVAEVVERYDAEGESDTFTDFVEAKKDEGTVIEIFPVDTDAAATGEGGGSSASTASNQVSDGSSVSTESDLGTDGTSTSTAANQEDDGTSVGEGTIDDDHNSHGDGQGSGRGNHGGNGQGMGNGQGVGSGQGQRHKIESQLEGHHSGEDFIVTTGNNDSLIEWQTFMETASDGTRIVGRMPLYATTEVIAAVKGFLTIFLLALFAVSMVFAYLFARSISRPVRELKELAQAMGELNFAGSYAGHRRDEIGDLGRTLNRLSAELEGTIAKLQAELGKERTLEKMRRLFNAQVSHEIQTPLAVIKSYTEALQDELVTDEGERDQYYTTIIHEADRISAITGDLLDLAQLEAGAYKLECRPISMKALIEEADERLTTLYPQRALTVTIDDSGGSVLGDNKRLAQVLDNLLSNAAKHSAEGTAIVLSTEVADERLVVRVENSGEPIPEAELGQIWDYFHRADEGRAGSGLGLAVVKGIITAHGGEVFIENTEAGVAAGFTLPLTVEKP